MLSKTSIIILSLMLIVGIGQNFIIGFSFARTVDVVLFFYFIERYFTYMGLIDTKAKAKLTSEEYQKKKIRIRLQGSVLATVVFGLFSYVYMTTEEYETYGFFTPVSILLFSLFIFSLVVAIYTMKHRS